MPNQTSDEVILLSSEYSNEKVPEINNNYTDEK